MPAKLIGRGRAADVFEHGPGRVLRRYREDFNAEREAGVMEFVRDAGYPVPHVYEAQGRDLVMERVDGPTMLADLGRRPWMLFSHASTLAQLHKRLQVIDAAKSLLELREAPGSKVVHGDLHIDNVILTAKGPVVIDWSGVHRGDPYADVVMTWVILAAARPPGSVWTRAIAGAGRSMFVDRFLSAFDRKELSRLVTPLGRLKLRDPNMSSAERLAIEAFIAGAARP
jgi:aminoglycoside phosphotransferase (APT) family kinase protein